MPTLRCMDTDSVKASKQNQTLLSKDYGLLLFVVRLMDVISERVCIVIIYFDMGSFEVFLWPVLLAIIILKNYKASIVFYRKLISYSHVVMFYLKSL